jgi:hypothetical protein
MKFGVIVCPRCKRAKGVDLSCRTTKCSRCGRILKLEVLKIFYRTDSSEKLRQAIGFVNAELDGKLEEFRETLKASRGRK